MRTILKLTAQGFWRVTQLGSMSTGMMLAIAVTTVQAQQITQARITEILDSDQVYVQARKVRKNDVAQAGEQIRTGKARAGLWFNVGAGARLGQNSTLVVGKGCIRLNRGLVLVAGSTGGDRGCLGGVVAATRGTVYIMELTDSGQGKIMVLEGEIEVSNPSQPDQTPVLLKTGQAVEISPQETIGSPFQLTSAQFTTVGTSLLEGFQAPLPDLQKIQIQSRSQRGFTDTFLQEALVGRDSSFQHDLPGLESANFVGVSVTGTFIRTSQNAGVFIPSSGAPTIPIAINVDNRTISIGGIAGVSNAFGLSGRNASGTVVLQTPLTLPGTTLTGQIIQLEVYDVEFKEPRIGQPFSGQLSVGRVRDR